MVKSKISDKNLVTLPKGLTKQWPKTQWVSWEKLPDGGIVVRPVSDALEMFGAVSRARQEEREVR